MTTEEILAAAGELAHVIPANQPEAASHAVDRE